MVLAIAVMSMALVNYVIDSILAEITSLHSLETPA